MSKLRTFFYVLKRTFTSPAYYADILKAPFSFSLKFFLLYFFFFALVGTGILTLKLVEPVKQTLAVLPSKLEALYPPDLEIRIQNGTVSTNVTEPFFVPLKDIEKVFNDDHVLGTATRPIVNVLVIDTQASVEDFQRYETAILLTKTNIVASKDNGGYEVYPVRDWPDMVINQTMVVKLVSTIKPFLKWVMPSLVGLIFLALAALMPSILATTLLWYALAIWVVAKLLSFPLSYKKSYQMGLHVVVLPITFTSLLGLAAVNITVPFFNTVVIVLLSGIIVNQLKKAPTAPPSPHSPREAGLTK